MSQQRASIYVRLSKAADEHNLSLAGMTADLRKLCDRMGLTVVAVHQDDGLSGGKRDRPEFQEWLSDAVEGRCDVLVTYHTDRLTREGLNHAAGILDVIEGKDPATGKQVRNPVRLIDAQGLDSEHGDAFRFRFVISAEVGRSERERIRTRTRASMRRLQQAGRVRGGPAPYGYRSVPAEDGKGFTYVIEPTEAKFIRECVRRVLSGENLGRVTRQANYAGHRPRRADEWSRAGLKQVLTGNAVLGRVGVRGEPLRDEEGRILTPFPAVISPEESAALRELLKPQKQRKQPPKKASHLLSGLLVCCGCGKSLVASTSGAGGNYRCQKQTACGVCRQPVSVNRAAVEAALTDLYLSKFGDEPMYRTRIVTEGSTRLAQINEDIAAVMQEMGQTASPEAFNRLQRLQEQRAEAESRPPVRRTLREPTGDTVREWWGSAHLDDRRDALRNAWGCLTLHPGTPGRKGFSLRRLTFERSAEEE